MNQDADDKPHVRPATARPVRTMAGLRPQRVHKLEALRRFSSDLDRARSVWATNPRDGSGFALEAVTKLLARLDGDDEHMRMFSGLIAALMDADDGVAAPLTKPRDWSRSEGRKPVPTAEYSARERAVEAVGLLMRVGLKLGQAAREVGEVLRLHGVPTGHVTTRPAAAVKEWRRAAGRAYGQGGAVIAALMRRIEPSLEALTPDEIKRELLGGLKDQLAARGYPTRK